MKHIVFTEPKEKQVEIELRCSMLNQYLNPSPFEFKDMDNKVECMNLWDRYHSVYQATILLWKDKWIKCYERHVRELKNMMPFIREKEMQWFMEWGMQIIEHACERFNDPTNQLEKNEDKLYCECVEEKRQIIIDFSWYKINMSWTSDADCGNLPIDKNDVDWVEERWHMIDIKSAWSKWTQEKADEERQKYYYTYLKCILEWLPWCRFDYHILTKQKKIQFQEFTYFITLEEAEKVLKQDLKLFILDNYVNK